jgi:predicted permease
MEQARELHRDNRGLPFVDTLLRDFRYALRTLRRDAGLTTFAILIVGLGVGASSTVFSVFNTLFLRPLPFHDPARIVWIANGESDNLSSQTVQVAYLLGLRTQSQSLSEVAAYSPFYGTGDIRLTGTGEPERLTGVPVTEGFFRLLGVKPQLGRTFTAEECREQAPKTVILSHGFWQRRLASDPSIVGRSVILDDEPATVVGVLPASFDFAAVFKPGSRVDLFRPFPLSPQKDAQGNTLALMARLTPGADIRTAQAEVTTIGANIAAERKRNLRRNEFNPRLSTLRERVSGKFRYALVVLVGAVGFLILLVCANLSNLLLVRASVRQKEMAIRSALGAARPQLIRQMMIESVTLACCGAALGVILAYVGTSALAGLENVAIPLLRDVQLDGVALGFAVLLALLTGAIFGLAPALQLSAVPLSKAMNEGGRGSISGGGWLRRAFVVAEVALVCILLTGAGLLGRSLVRVLDVELGFEKDNVVALRVDPSRAYSTHEERNAYFDQVLRSVRAIPGVEAVGLTDALPMGDNFGWRRWDAVAKGQNVEPEHHLSPLVRMIDTGYLAAMKIPLRAGRAFTPADNKTSERVIIVNEDLAQALWPGEDPLGRIITTSNEDRRVVGVVGGVRYFAPERGAGSEMYMPIAQTGDHQVVDLVLRGAVPPSTLTPSIRAALRQVDPYLPATQFRTMQQLVDQSVFPRRFIVLLVAGFAVFGLVLASLGIYAVISYSVSQRKQEIGIRMALGASAQDLQRRFVLQTLKLALLGLLIGVPASWMASRAIQGLLFGVTSSDPLTFTSVLALLSTVAALAGYLPARRASRLNPLDALRTD